MQILKTSKKGCKSSKRRFEYIKKMYRIQDREPSALAVLNEFTNGTTGGAIIGKPYKKYPMKRRKNNGRKALQKKRKDSCIKRSRYQKMHQMIFS